MKNLKFILFFLIIFSCTIDSKDSIDNNDVIILSHSQVSNFINVLPEILEFSEKYQALLSPEEKNSPDYNKKFFKALRQSKKINDLIKQNNFDSIDNFLLVYKNIVIAYTSLITEFTNFNNEIINIKEKLNNIKSQISNAITDKNLPKSQKIQYTKMLNDIYIDEIRIYNIELINNYIKDIESAMKK